jgi:hypothetical protein
MLLGAKLSLRDTTIRQPKPRRNIVVLPHRDTD